MLPEIKILFGYHAIQGDIPGLLINSGYLLKLVGDSDQPGCSPESPVSVIAQSSVVKASPHAEAITIGVESDQGEQYEIQSPWRDRGMFAYAGFEDSETVLPETFAGVKFREPKRLLRWRTKYRQIAPFIQFPHPGQDIVGGYLAVFLQIEGDTPAVQEERRTAQPFCQGVTVLTLFMRG